MTFTENSESTAFRPIMPVVQRYTVRFKKANGKPGSVSVMAGSEREAREQIGIVILEVFSGATALTELECE